jgi:hypothetical protein
MAGSNERFERLPFMAALSFFVIFVNNLLIYFSFFYHLFNIKKGLHKIKRNWLLGKGLLKFKFGVECVRSKHHAILLLIDIFLSWLGGWEGIDDSIFGFVPLSKMAFAHLFYVDPMRSIFSLVAHVILVSYKLLYVNNIN